LNLGVSLNNNLPIYRRLTKGGVVSHPAEAAAADQQIRDMRIRPPWRDAHVSSLSGGNQQKVLVGKWLNHVARLFIFDEPTAGVDVGTKAEIYKLFAKILQGGAGIILSAGGLRPFRYPACLSPWTARCQPSEQQGQRESVT
jgi:ribose transport system ATP-binding protein